MNTEKVYQLAMQQIESRLLDFLHANSFFIHDQSAYNGRCEVVNAAELEELLEKLFEDVKGGDCNVIRLHFHVYLHHDSRGR